MSSLPSCSSDRPDSWATHRTLYLPDAFVSAAPAAELAAWANALCCVYVHVESAAVSVPSLTTYDGEVRPYPMSLTAISASETAYTDVCQMGMGSTDCQRQEACVSAALEAQNLSVPVTPSDGDGSSWPIGATIALIVAGVVSLLVVIGVVIVAVKRRRRPSKGKESEVEPHP